MTKYQIEPQDVTLLGNTYTLDVVGLAIAYTPGMTKMPVSYQLFANTGSLQITAGSVTLDETVLANWDRDWETYYV